METVLNLDKSTIKGLQDLITINLDSQHGFEAAAEQIENKDIANYFRRCGERRGTFAHELQRAIKTTGENPTDHGSISGTVHRWWLNIRGTVQGGDEHAVLSEAERGEDAIKARYENVLKETAGSPYNAVLQRQYASVKEAHDTIRDMRDARA